jgi:hypothetical protein
VDSEAGHAFISYARVDRVRVDVLANVLRAASIPVWRDTDALWPGDEWKLEIRRAIERDTLAFLACFSRASVGRPRGYQNEELNLAAEVMRQRPPGGPAWLIPIRFDDCEIPDFAIGGGRTLNDLQRVDLFGSDEESSRDRLVEIVAKITSGALQTRRPEGCGVVVSYWSEDTGWAANAVAGALRRRPGPSEVLLDNRSIALGDAFAHTLEDSVRRSAVMLVLIGPRWTEPPVRDRHGPQDWLRREIVLAQSLQLRVVPVLVDPAAGPAAKSLPAQLRFLAGLQAVSLRQSSPGDADVLADKIAELLPPECGDQMAPPDLGATTPPAQGVERTRAALDALLRHILPGFQQTMGNRDRLVELVLALLTPDDRLVYLAPARFEGRRNGSATVLVTETDVVVADVDEKFQISSGEIRFPRSQLRRVELVLTRRLGMLKTADVILHMVAGDRVELLGLLRHQASQLVDHLSS